VKRAYDLHVRAFLQEWFAADDGPGPSYPADPAAFVRWDDGRVLAAMRERADRSDPARRVLERRHHRAVVQTSGHADAADLERFEAARETLAAALPGCPLIEDSSETAPHRFGQGRFLVHGRGRRPMPIEEASPVLADLRKIRQHRLYVPREHEAAARAALRE
jgi:hypothetical protein